MLRCKTSTGGTMAILGIFLAALGCASGQTVEEQEAERRDTFIVTRLVAPRDVSIGELRIRDVDTGSLYSVGGRVGEPLLIKVKAGRYRFKSLQATIPNGEEPKFDQPERALDILGCCINYIGDIVITDRRRGYELYIDARPQTVIDASYLYPEIFEGQSVLLIRGDQKPAKLVFEDEEGNALTGLEGSGPSETAPAD